MPVPYTPLAIANQFIKLGSTMTKMHQGFIGRFTGSCDLVLNVAFAILVILGVISIIFAFASLSNDKSVDIFRYTFTGLLTVIGYIFGRTS